MSKRWRVWVDLEDDEDGTAVWMSTGGYEVYEDAQRVTTKVVSYPRRMAETWEERCLALMDEAMWWHADQEAFPL